MVEQGTTPRYSLAGFIWQVCFAALLIYWFWRLPEPGYAVTILGLAAIVMAVRASRFSRTEEIAWIVIAVALCFVEIRAIRHDRDIAAKDQADARAREEANFRNIAAGINDSISSSNKQFQTMIGELNNTLQASTATLRNTQPRAALEWQALTPAGPHFQIPSPLMRFNVFYMNYGNDVARRVRNGAKIYARKPDNSEAAREVVDDFNKVWKNLSLSPAVDVNPNAPRFFTFTTDNLTEDEMKGISDHTLTLYVIMRFTWSDRTGNWVGDECLSMQDPTRDLRVGHPCQVKLDPHYRTKRLH